jgi:hypothetical protein
MEEVALFKRVIGLDVHQYRSRPVRGLRKSMAARASIWWVQTGSPRTCRVGGFVAARRGRDGIYWRSPTALEAVGIRAKVVNARHGPSAVRNALALGSISLTLKLGRLTAE